MKKRRRGGGEIIKTEYACIKFNTFVPMATIQHVIHLSSCIRADVVHCLGPGERGCLEQPRPPLPPSDRHPGHSPCCYFSLIHIQLAFSSLITRQITTTAKKKRRGIMQSNTKALLLWFLWIGEGAVGLGRNSGPLLPDQHLKDFPALVYRFGGRWRQCRASTSMTACQDQFNSHNGRKGHLTSVIFSNMLQSCCWLALLRHFPLWIELCRLDVKPVQTLLNVTHPLSNAQHSSSLFLSFSQICCLRRGVKGSGITEHFLNMFCF